MSRLRVGCIGAAMLVIASGCGTSDPAASVPASTPATVEQTAQDPEAAAYVDALVASGVSHPDLSATEQRCYAERSVEIVGVEAYQAEAITPDDLRAGTFDDRFARLYQGLTAEQEAALQDAWTACTQGRQMEMVWLTELDATVPTDEKLFMGARVAADDQQGYIGLSDGVLHAVRSADGVEAWSFDASGAARPSDGAMADSARFDLFPAVSGDSVYLGTNTGVVYALDRDTGALRWSYDTATVTGQPMVIDDVVVVGDWTALPEVNNVDWPTYLGAASSSDDEDGRAAITQLQGLDATTGELLWATPMPNMTALAAASDGVLAVASASSPSDSAVLRVDPATGATTWTVAGGGTVRPAVHGTTVYTLDDTTMVALDAASGEQRWATDVAGTSYSGSTGGWPVQIEATSDVAAAVVGGDPWWVIGIQASTGQRLWEHEGDSEGGFDIATVGDDLLIAPTNVPFFLADPFTGDSQAYVDTDQLPVNEHANPVTPSVAARSGDLWIAAGGAWIVGLK